MTTQPRDTARNRPESQPRRTAYRQANSSPGRTKRAITTVLGGILLIRGFRRGSFRGIASVLVGAWLLVSAVRSGTRHQRSTQSRTVSGSREDERNYASDAATVGRSITVRKPATELYETWRDPEQLSQIMGHFADVTALDEDRFQWTIRGPRGTDLSWETRIVAAEPGEFLRWETETDAIVSSKGSVRFRPAPGDRGTMVTLSMSFDPPGGALGERALKRLDIVPESLVGEALGRFKSLVESGEIPTLEENPSARGKGDLL